MQRRKRVFMLTSGYHPAKQPISYVALQRSPVSRQNIYHTSDSRYLEILGTSKASII